MLFKSTIFAQASGSVGGLVFARNRGGAYIRNRTVPVNPNTERQQAVRTSMGAAVSSWADELSDDQRATWNNYAANVPVKNALGDTVYLTGQQWFIGSYVVRVQANVSVPAFGPISYERPPGDLMLGVTCSAATGELSVSFNPALKWASENGGAMSVAVSNPLNPTVNFYKAPFRFAGSILGDGTTPPTSPAAISVGTPVVPGQKLIVRCRIIENDGAYGDYMYVSCIVEA